MVYVKERYLTFKRRSIFAGCFKYFLGTQNSNKCDAFFDQTGEIITGFKKSVKRSAGSAGSKRSARSAGNENTLYNQSSGWL